MTRTAVLLASRLLPGTLPAQDEPKDLHSDPLPPGAKGRLGTERMRILGGYPTPRLHPDGKRVIASVRGRLTLLDPATGKELKGFGDFKIYVSAGPVFSPDEKRVAVVGDPSGRATISVFDWETGQRTHTFQGHKAG